MLELFLLLNRIRILLLVPPTRRRVVLVLAAVSDSIDANVPVLLLLDELDFGTEKKQSVIFLF